MTTIIDNTQRLFLVQRQGFGGYNDFFCNLATLPEVIQTQLEPNDDFKILHYWNRSFKRISNKAINEMFVAAKIPFKITSK